MATRTQNPATPTAKKSSRKEPQCKAIANDAENGCDVARLAISPEFAAYRVIGAAEAKTPIGSLLDVTAIMKKLRGQSAAVNRGDLSQAEAMLMNQATALQSLFVRLAEVSMEARGLPQQETAMRLALKAQSQCRATLETLANVMNPPIVIARQANVTTGPQQINNAAAPSRARENEIEPNKLSGDNNNELLPYPRASTVASRVDPQVAAVGERDRAQIRRG